MSWRPRSWWPRAGLPAILLITLAVGAGLERVPSMEPARRALQRQYAPREDFPGNQTLKLLVTQGALHPYPINRLESEERSLIRARGRGRWAEHASAMNLYGVVETPPEELPSTTRLPAEERTSAVPVLSVVLAEQDLKGLLRQPMLRGRETERTAYVSYLRPGRPVLGFSAGIRLHGGRSRQGSQNKSFRLYLRPVHGVESLPASTFFAERAGAPSHVRRLVIHNDVRTDNFGLDWHLVNPIAYEISRRIGSRTPRTRPARFYLNGEFQGVYVLTERLDATYFEAVFGHRDFVLARTKLDAGANRVQAGAARDYHEFVRWALDSRRLPPAELPKQVNLDNLFRWYISILLCGTEDPLQGPLVRSNRGPDRRWFWTNWDMDHSFMSAAKRPVEQRWAVNDIPRVLYRREPRSRLLQSATFSQEFGPGFVDLFSEALNHRASKAVLDEVVDRYQKLAAEAGIADLSSFEGVRGFLAERPAALRLHMSEQIGAPSFAVRVDLDPGRTIQVDGHLKEHAYEGWYFEGQSVRLRVSDEDRGAFDHWEVDGRALPDSTPRLEWRVRADTRLAPVFVADGSPDEETGS